MPRGQRGKRPTLTLEEGLAASTLTFREAAKRYGTSFETWRKLREGKGFLPFRGTGLEEEVASRVLESVRTHPHLNTVQRARQLGLGTGSVAAFLGDRGLSNLHARLRFAGYQVEAVRPLEIARNRRLVASRPGALTHADYKTFGFLRGVHGEPSVRLGGFIFIDSLTSFATLRLAKAPDAIEAIAAFGDYVERAPFDLFGLLLTDNGGAFISDLFISAVRRAGLQHRTIRPSHPWSNGKVEAMNKTLKYQCFAAIAGNVQKWDNAVALVDRWMEYYNTSRSHGGHCNRGLPPLPFYNLWQKTPGDDIAKLISLGIIKIDQEWDVRLMGSETAVEGEAAPLPWAFVMDRRTTPSLQAALGLPPPGDPISQGAGKGSNIILAR